MQYEISSKYIISGPKMGSYEALSIILIRWSQILRKGPNREKLI